MKVLTTTILNQFLKLVGERLSGDWVLMGGTVLPLLGIDLRTTTDIDLVPIDSKSANESVLSLMKLAEELGLPVETINQAGLFFLEKLPGYRKI